MLRRKRRQYASSSQRKCLLCEIKAPETHFQHETELYLVDLASDTATLIDPSTAEDDTRVPLCQREARHRTMGV